MSEPKIKFITHTIAFVIGLFVMAIMFKQCNPCPEIGASKRTSFRKQTIKVKYDSTYKEAYFSLLDQIPEEQPVYKNKVPKRIQKLIEKEDKKDSCGSIRKFVNLINDSNDQVKITGKITTLARGQVLSTDFEFKTRSLVVDTDVVMLDSAYVENTKYIVSNKLFLSTETSFSPGFMQLSGSADFITKKGWIFGYRYERNFDYNYQAHHAKIGRLISFRRKDGKKEQ